MHNKGRQALRRRAVFIGAGAGSRLRDPQHRAQTDMRVLGLLEIHSGRQRHVSIANGVAQLIFAGTAGRRDFVGIAVGVGSPAAKSSVQSDGDITRKHERFLTPVEAGFLA